jgi:predicted lipoprotein with Yx(FWY)xxD motif
MSAVELAYHRTMTRRKAWAIPVLITVALTATACSKATGYTSGSGSQAGGAYGNQATSTPTTGTGADAMPGAVQTAALKVERTKAGMVLAGGKGLTLYYYTADKPGSGKSVCTASCAAAWPPLKAPVKAPAGVRMPGPLGMITRPGGVKQVTLNGFPIYYYAADKAPGQATGNGAEGTWHVIKIRTSAATTGRVSVLKAERTKAGTVLAGGQGLTLYYYTADKPGSGKSVCTGSCATAWPPLAAPVKAPAGVHMPGPMGMITRPDGTKQVTINGYPLYYYAGDKAPGQVTGNGADGTWHVIKLKTKSGSTATTAPAATATPTTNTGGGYGY